MASFRLFSRWRPSAKVPMVRMANITHHAHFAPIGQIIADIWPFVLFFKMAAVRRVGFLKFRIFNCQYDRRTNPNMHHHAKFRADRIKLKRCQDMAVCLCFKMAAVRHLGFLKVGKVKKTVGLNMSQYNIGC